MRKRKSKSSFCQVDHLELRQLLSATIYVSAAATGSTHDGASWATAFTDLQSGLTAAAGEASSSNPVIIEVGQGTYYPTSTTGPRTASFQLIDDVSIQGGYAGAGQANPDAHNVTEYPTILSGDIGTTGDNADNSYHVVTGSGANSTAVLDGFTVTDGNASAGGGTNADGGGIFDNAGSPTISNCTISGNTGGIQGGGMYNIYSSSPTLTNCTISGNTAADSGGGILNVFSSSPTLTNCTISGNTADEYGGGIFNVYYSSPTLTNCTISGNTADVDDGGGMYNRSFSSPTLTNCTISGNTAGFGGGGMYNENASPVLINDALVGNSAGGYGGGLADSNGSSLTLTNCTLTGNSAGSNGGAVYNFSASALAVTNSIFWGDTVNSAGNEIASDSTGADTVTVSYSDIDQSGYAGSNIDSDPLFISSSNLRLQAGSPAIGAGNAGASGLSGVTTDLDGLPRIVNGSVDMGAYESHWTTDSTVYVDASATAMPDGESWQTAYPNLSLALIYVGNGDTVEVAQGIYYPTAGTDRTATFQLIDNVAIEGGFAGQADPTAAQNVSAYPTILSGGIGTTGSSGYSYHVVTGSGTDSTAVLDGFTITGGNASGANGSNSDGGGIYDNSGDPTINDCIITGNTAGWGGGGLYAISDAPTLTDCTISGNTAGSSGGGMYIRFASMDASDCTITGNNSPGNGGGILLDSVSLALNDCTITGNSTPNSGGGLANIDSSLALINCTLSGNTAGTSGGGMYNYSSSLTLTNCILWGDTVSSASNEINNASTNSITVAYSDIEGGYAGTGNIDANPLFVDAADGNFQIEPYSPAVDSGDNAAVPNGITTDLAGNNRFQDVPTSAHAGSGSIPIVDMGAYEAAPALAASAGGPYTVLAGQSIQLTGFGSSGVSGALNYGWSINNDNAFTDLTGADPTFSTAGYAAGTQIAITLRITDSGGSSTTASGTITVALPVIYVDASATGQNNGSSWTNALTSLTAALAQATADSGQSIDVAQGTYYPTAGTDRTATFQLIDGVAIEGGFAGQADPTAAQNPTAYPTILSGDIGTTGDNADNSYHVVTGSGANSTAVLDGFTVTDGNASAGGGTNADGGGIFESFGSPTISDCAITGNTAADSGGGMYNSNYSSPILTDCTLSGNTAAENGGGMNSNYSSPILTDCTLSGNTADDSGGGIFDNAGSPTISDCTISGNSANLDGGGIYTANYSLTLTNCTLSGNTAGGNGGGIYSNNSSSVTLTNSILWGDTISGTDNEIVNGSSGTNTVTVTYSDIDGGYAGAGNINSDPLFVDAGSSDFQLQGASPAINAGSNAAVSGVTTDLAGNPRIADGTVDMGAYEYIVASRLVITTQPANAVAGSTMSAITVDVEDQYGDVVTSDASSITLTGPSNAGLAGTLTEPVVNGAATFSDLSLTTAGSYTLAFGDTDNGTALTPANSDSFAIASAAAAKLVVTQQPGNGVAGQTMPNFAIEVQDQYGNLVTSNTSTVAIASTPAGISTSIAAVDGIAIFVGVTPDTAGTFTLSASDGSLAGATSSSFTISPAAAAKLVVTQQPGNGVAGQTMANFAIEVQDQYGNLVTSNTSTVAIASTPAGIATSVAAVDGIAIFTGLSTDTAGTYTLSASDGTLAGATSSSFTITPGAAATLVITQQPASTLAGQNIPIQVEVEDQYGNAVDGSSVTLALAGSAPSGAILAGTLTEPTANGIATFSDLSLNRAGSDYTLSASDGSLPAVTTQSFAITYAGPQLVFASEPANAVAGGKLPAFTINTDDTAGNIVTGGKSKITLTLSSGGKIYGSAKATVNKKTGMATFKNISLHTAGTYTLTAADSSYASGISTEFTITAGAAKKLAFNPQPANAAANTPFNVSVELLDQYGNAVNDGSTVDLVLGAHPKTAVSLNSSAAVSDGFADFDDVTLDTAGPYTLIASDGKLKATSKKFEVA